MKRENVFFKLITVFCLILLLFLNQSCKHEPLGTDKMDQVCFDPQVLRIFQTSCAISGCHDGSSENDFVATDYNSIMRGVKPGKPNESMVYKVLGREYGQLMPPDRPLSKEDRMLIEIWIAQGAKNTHCDSTGTVTEPPFNKDSICFNQSILPILRSSCGITGCHDNITHQEGYVLMSYSTLTQRAGSIVPFNSAQSRIYRSMVATGEDLMPPTGRLPSAQIEAFRKWIDQGALNSDCPQIGCDTTGVLSFSTQVFPVIQNNCLGCHGSTNPSGGVSLTNYNQVRIYVDNTRNSVPVLVGAIRQLPGFSAMPPGGKLDKCAIRKIELWIQQGKQNN